MEFLTLCNKIFFCILIHLPDSIRYLYDEILYDIAIFWFSGWLLWKWTKFIILGIIYFNPQIQGYELKQNDYSTYLGMSKEITDFRDKTGIDPLWTNSMFSGMPAYQINSKHDNYIAKIRNWIFFDTLNTPLVYIFLCFIGFYIFKLCRLKVKKI